MFRNNMQCSLCKQMGTTENEDHLLVCPILTKHPKLKDIIGDVRYTDVFADEKKQKRAAEVFKEISIIYERNKNCEQNQT